MFDFNVQFGDRSTRVTVRAGILQEVGRAVRELDPRASLPPVIVVTDERVGALYAQTVLDSLEEVRLQALVFRIAPGEESKSLEMAGRLYEWLARHAVPRDAVILALGGGVVSDLAGFVAATWMRGVTLAICPTTLEADIDASIGGKTAVNIPGAKNLVGAFHQPALVAIDPVCLETLDIRDIRAGLAESIKHALICSDKLLSWHETNSDSILALDEPTVTELIHENVRIKAGIVEKDACERSGLRMLLNFGHTIGHAIEACGGFALRHGECVSLGMIAACRLSNATGLLNDAVVTRVESILGRFGLPTRLTEPIDADRIMDTIRRDKKTRGDTTRVVLLEDVGRPIVRDDVPRRRVREAFESLLP